MSLAALAHTVAEFARARDVTLARIPIGWPGTACRFEHPLDYLGKDGGGAVGTGPGHTIGSALALKGSGRLVVGVVGDGDFLMGVNALWTAAHLELPVILIVANNGGYYNDVRHQERVAAERGRPIENKWIGQELGQPTPDIVALARAQGFDGEGPVRARIDLVAALDRAEACFLSGGQYVIDVRSAAIESRFWERRSIPLRRSNWPTAIGRSTARSNKRGHDRLHRIVAASFEAP